jgi:DNA topoisomerase-1
VLFPGYQKVARAPRSADEGEEGDEEQKLPPLTEREPLACLKWLSDRKETKPPPRFNEASLVRELERNGVGRPSTYAQILSTIQQRQYVANQKRTLVPTELGRNVNDLLVATLDNLFDVGFTATMEEALDAVERGETEWTQMLASFYASFQEWMAKTRLPPANDAHVRRTLALFEGVTEWAPPVQRGKRTFSDEKFVASVAEQVENKSREVSQRQLEALVKILWRYREQVPDAEAALREIGFGNLLDHPDMQPPRETTAQKLAIAAGLELNERSRAFVESLAGRVRGGSRLTPAQLAALNGVLESHARQIENYEALRAELGLGAPPEADTESGPLLDAMRNVKTWNEPVQRGRRAFNDEEFFGSLSEQYAGRGSLSPRQRTALKRMVHRYRGQIPDYEALARRFELGRGAKRGEKQVS